MSEKDSISTYSQIESINSNFTYIELDNEPIAKSIWLIFDECNNEVLYNYKLYNGYEYLNYEDIRLISIVDNIPENKNDYITYISYNNSINYIDCLLGQVCKYDGEQITEVDPDTGVVITEPKTYQIITQDMLTDDNKKDTFEHFKKNLIGKFFIDWGISEQIKSMIKNNNVSTVQINYWY